MLKKHWLSIIILLVFIPAFTFSQSLNDSINKEYITEAISYLASDKLRGRVNHSKEQLEAAEFLNKEFAGFGLQLFPGYTDHYIPFRTSWGRKSDGGELFLDGKKIDDSLFIFIKHKLIVSEKKLSDFMMLMAEPPLASTLLYNSWENFQSNILIWIPLPDGLSFSEAIQNVILPVEVPASDILIVASKEEPKELKFTGNKKILGSVLYNIVGLIPGKSLPDEFIIFSAHYDHIDHGLNGEFNGIYNGANDNASGTTAVLALAKYFAMRNDNERTLLFCLFAGEELGLLGSKSFVEMIKPDHVKAMINIEMIGMTNATGKNTFMTTGSYYSNLTEILRSNLKGEIVKVIDHRSDPNYLFQRSDNYPFAMKGVPAHSIMCSDDKEPCYHKPCDDVKRIDMENMTRIIQAIAQSCVSIINGKDTPTRIK